MEGLLFILFALGSVISALGVVFAKNPIKSALWLIACFFFVACLFLLQSAELIGVLQVLVYAGAIMVLFVFVIMLVENKDDPILAPALGSRAALPIKLAGVALVLYGFFSVIGNSVLADSSALPMGFGTVSSIGREFFSRYLFHFELTSILLLVGIVGAVIVSKRRPGKES